MGSKARFSLFSLIVAVLALVLAIPQVMAQDDNVTKIEFTGTVTAIAADGLTLTVDGLVVDVTDAEINLVVEVGTLVKVEGTLLDDGSVAAREVGAPDDQIGDDSVDDSGNDSVDDSSDDSADDNGDDSSDDLVDDNGDDDSADDDALELVGTLDSLNSETAVVGGMAFSVASAEIDEDVTVGELVKIHASLSDDGATWAAREIEVASADDLSFDDSGDDLGDDSGDDVGDDHGGDNSGDDFADDSGDDVGDDHGGDDIGDDHGGDDSGDDSVDDSGHDVGDDHGGDDGVSDDGSGHDAGDDHGGDGGSDDSGHGGGDD